MTENQPSKNNLKFLKSAAGFAFEIIKAFVISLAIILPIRYFLIQPFYVQGASMEPTFSTHDYLIINEIEYRFEAPTRGDVVVFKSPYSQKEYFIKRIIGLPGEKLEIKDGQIYIYNQEHPQGFVLPEDYLPGIQTYTEGKQYSQLQIKNNEYFVLGDNRNASLDSRNFGAIPRQNVIGRAWIRGWPFTKLSIFNKVNYNKINTNY